MPSLELAEERWRLSIDNAPIGVALVGLDGRFLRVSAALGELLGHSVDELLTLDFQRITHPDDLGGSVELARRMVAGEIDQFSIRKRYLHSDGHVVWADLSTALVRNPEGEPLHFVSHLTDRTAEVAAQDRLQASNADLEAFALVASHDLQAPLATVRGYLELLSMEYAEALGDQGAEWVRRASEAARRMTGQLSSLLEFSRVTIVDAERPEALLVEDLVTEVTADLRALITETGASVSVAPGPPLHAQRAPVRRVLQNLVENALKHRAPDRRPVVRVETHPTPDHWLVTVSDNGPGIPDAAKDRIFEMFNRLDGDAEGHGIGLAAARRLLSRQGGAIWVEDAETGGSRFAFTVPH